MTSSESGCLVGRGETRQSWSLALLSEGPAGADVYQPIEDYGIIGDLHTVALVGGDGSIDFMSFPGFDSPTVFARLVDHERGGRFSIRPCLESGVRKQLYLPETNILLSRFLSKEGVAEVSDFMPVGDAADDTPRALRRVKTVRGTVTLTNICGPERSAPRGA